MQKIVFLDASTIRPEEIDLSPIAALGDLVTHDTTAPGEVPARLQGAAVAITNKVPISEADLDALPDLRLVVAAATGTDHIASTAARARGIAVRNVAAYSTDSVAQHTAALLLCLATRCHTLHAERHLWPDSPIFTRLDHPAVELAGKTLGIAGLGQIGQRVAEIARALGMQVQALAREGASADTNTPRLAHREFFASSDAISLHCPLTADTHHLVGHEELALMPPHAFLINTGRGQLVDTRALAGAITTGQIGGAAIDVLPTEPPPHDDPLLALDSPNLLITPHTAWAPRESRERLVAGIAHNIQSFQSQNPQYTKR